MLKTSTRLLQLLTLLQTRRSWAGAALAQELDVTTRTVRNDVERLRELGYPVAASPGVEGGYRLGAGADLPPLLLNDEEAVAVAVGLSSAATGAITGIEESSLRALAKLEQVMPARVRQRCQTVQQAVVAVPRAAAAIDARTLTTIAAACRDNERLRFDYRSHAGAGSLRDTEPHRVVHDGRRWYLSAWDRDRGDWRTFRVDRLTRPHASGRFQPRELPAEDAATFVSRSLRARPNRYEARLTLHASAEEMRKRAPRYVGPFEPLGEDRCEYRTGDDNLDWLAARLTMLGVEFEVHEPPELIEHLQALAARLARAAQPA